MGSALKMMTQWSISGIMPNKGISTRVPPRLHVHSTARMLNWLAETYTCMLRAIDVLPDLHLRLLPK